MGESYSRGICSIQFTVEDASKELPNLTFVTFVTCVTLLDIGRDREKEHNCQEIAGETKVRRSGAYLTYGVTLVSRSFSPTRIPRFPTTVNFLRAFICHIN